MQIYPGGKKKPGVFSAWGDLTLRSIFRVKMLSMQLIVKPVKTTKTCLLTTNGPSFEVIALETYAQLGLPESFL